MLKNTSYLVAMCTVLVATLPGMLSAHHSRSAFDLDATVVVEGMVTEVGWTNPHYYLSVIARSDGAEWVFEGHSIPGLVRNGWTRTTLIVGTQVRISAKPNRKTAIRFALLDHVTRTDGKTFYSFRPTDEQRAKQSPPLLPSTDLSGTWRLIRSLRANLVGGFKPPLDWPLTDTARREAEAFDIHDDPATRCEPIGIPRKLGYPYAQKWTIDDEGIAIVFEHSTDTRMFLNIGSQGVAKHGLGVSVIGEQSAGHLIVITQGFLTKDWGLARGIGSSSSKHILETYELAEDGYRLDLTYVVEDPEYLTEPVTEHHSYAKVHDYEFAEEPPCDIATATRHWEFESDAGR
jgi:hypothetical protein